MREKYRTKENLEISETLIGLLALKPDIYEGAIRYYHEISGINEKAKLLDGQKELIKRILRYAASSDDPFVLKTVLSANFSYRGFEAAKGWALFHAMNQQHSICVDLLLTAGANPNFQFSGGYYVLMLCCTKDDTAMLQRIIEAGALLNVRNDEGQTALILALDYGAVRIAEDLLSRGANIHIRDKKMKTALMVAAQFGRANCVKILLAKGARLKARDTERKTALTWAKAGGNPECVRLIENAMKAQRLHVC